MRRYLLILFIVICSCFLFAQDKRGWTMYPNPAHDHITIESLDNTLPPIVKIYDFNGRLVLEKNIGRENHSVEIELNLRPGTYIVTMEDR
jgi:hypothetical protein